MKRPSRMTTNPKFTELVDRRSRMQTLRMPTGVTMVLLAILLCQLPGCSDAAGERTPSVGSSASGCRLGVSATTRKRKTADTASTIVLACGKAPYYGRVEIVGHRMGDDICVSTHLPERHEIHGGTCKPSSVPWEVICAGAQACITGSNNAHNVIEYSGIYTGEVRTIRATVESGKKAGGTPSVTTGFVRDGLLKRLDQSEEFGVFVVSVRGCKMGRRLSLDAVDKNNEQVPVSTAASGMKPLCGG
jgi:hypothetical protein